jgi:hypothetical protein
MLAAEVCAIIQCCVTATPATYACKALLLTFTMPLLRALTLHSILSCFSASTTVSCTILVFFTLSIHSMTSNNV